MIDITNFMRGLLKQSTPSGAKEYLKIVETAAAAATSPGGSDKNVQYNNNGAFGGVANNATASNKFVRQVSGGTPSIEFVTDADLSTSDITTNNVSTSKHGFAPKAPNNAALYLDGTGAYSSPNTTLAAFDNMTWKYQEIASQNNSNNPTTRGTQVSTAGTASTAAATQFAFDSFTRATTGTAGADAGIFEAATDCRMDYTLRMVSAIQLATATNCRCFIGMAATSAIADITGAAVPIVVFAGFRFDTGVPDTNWTAIFYNGTTSETFNTGVAVDTTRMPLFEVRWDGAGGAITFYINGSLVATSTLGMPALSTELAAFGVVRNLANEIKSLRFGYIRTMYKTAF